LSHAGTLRPAAESLRAFLENSEAVVLAPGKAAADEFARAACETGLRGVHRMTLNQLAAILATQPLAQHGLAPVSALGTEALAARVVHILKRQNKLDYFRPVAEMPGFARALAATLTELRLNGVDAVDLAATGAPGQDLARLASLYEDELAARSLADLAVLLRLGAEVARDRAHRFVGLPLLLLHVRLDSESHRLLISALVQKSPAVFAAAVSGDDRGIRALEGILGVPAEEIEGPATALDRLRRHLFVTESARAETGKEGLEFYSAPGEGLECVEIARRIQRLAGQGFAFDRMAILLRSPERYQPLVEEALRRAGIPGYLSRGSARPDPAGRALLALLACAAEGCTASRFAEYLSLGQAAAHKSETPWAPPEDEILAGLHAAEPAVTEEEDETEGALNTPFAWEKLLVDAAVIGGRERWARRLAGLEAEFRLRLGELDPEDPHREHLERQIERLGNLRRFALPLIDVLASLPQKALWGEWLERLAELAQLALRRPESVLSMLNELQAMNEVGPVDLDEVYGVLMDRLRFLRREPPLRRYGRVFVGAVEEAQGRHFDVVFLPGLTESLFPRRALEDPLLLDDYRKKLGRGLALLDDRVARERMLLRGAAAAAGARLIVSYPSMDTAQARPRVPSFYAMEVVRAAEGKLPGLRDFELRAREAAPARLGWPAPKEPAEAIDDAEYDLASLNRALRLPREKAKGTGRYLVQVNPHLARSLRTRGRRWRNFWSSADGMVDPDSAALEVLAEHRLSRRGYSPSSLQHFALCPYRFLLHGIHRLRPREEPVALEQMDALTRGSLFHAVQFELFRELEREGAGNALEIADRVLDRVAAQYEEDLAPAIPRVWKSEVEDLRTNLRGWVRRLVASFDEWQPIHYEYGFGIAEKENRDPESSPDEAVILDGVRLRGSMDLVEKHRTRGVLRVTDHKTGKAPDPAPVFVGGGAVLQPLLYGLAAEQLLKQPVDSSRLFYCTERGNYTEVEIRLTEDARARIRQVTATIDRAIESGFLPAAPRAEACEHCDYRMVCGPYEEQRVRRKQIARLEPVLEVRRMP
jgi:ATP-dependent helicase/nuclease subunit B